MGIKKGYNNSGSWEGLEKENPNTQKIQLDENVLSELGNTDLEDDSDDNEYEEFEEVTEFNSPNNSSEPDKSEEKPGEFSDVLQLTQYSDNQIDNFKGDDIVIAEYNDINTVEIAKKHQIAAKKFVTKITKFILDFNDVQLSEEHKKYIKNVGDLQLAHLEDLLYLVDVNKQMLNNIIARVNATQAEDYAIINSYNNLTNQHLKLIKELQNTYKSIPNTLKKMRADVLCDQELQEGDVDDEVVTSEYGETQFNNSKQMLRKMLDKRAAKKEKKEEESEEENPENKEN